MTIFCISNSLSKYTFRTKLLYFSQSWHPSNFLSNISWCEAVACILVLHRKLEKNSNVHCCCCCSILLFLGASEYTKWGIFFHSWVLIKLRWKPLKIEWEATSARPITCKVVVTWLQTACNILKRQQHWMYSNGLELKRIWWLLGCHMCQGYLAGLV